MTHLPHLRYLARLTRMGFLGFPPLGGQGQEERAQRHCTMSTPGKKKRVYDQKFKEAAVEMYINGQRSGPAVARDLGICRRTLHLWVKELNPTAKAMPQSPAQLQAQLRSARAELQSLRNQCEILKKTLAILSAPASAAKE